MINTDLLDFLLSKLGDKKFNVYPEYTKFADQYTTCSDNALIVHSHAIFSSPQLIVLYYIVDPSSVSKYKCSEDVYTALITSLVSLSKSELGLVVKQLETEFMLGINHD